MRTPSLFSVPSDLSPAERQRRRHMLARTGLAWLGMMQVMMFAFPGYLRSPSMSSDNLLLLDQAIVLMNWISLILTVPVLLYCGWPVWRGAFTRMRYGHVSIDLPVALGLVAAFLPSLHATWTGQGEVYFDSVTMFLAFLLTARYLELCARQSAGQDASSRWLAEFRQRVSTHANRLAFWFVVAQLALAFLVAGVWALQAPDRAVPVLVAMLVMSCPCAMAMSVPTAVAAANAALAARPAENEDQSLRLAQATGRVARQNLYGSIAWHFLMTPLAAAGLVAPWLAAISMLVSSMAVAANAWRLYRSHVRQPAAAWRAVQAIHG